ncbi:MAG: exodeoxyribonuclease V subunit beta [Methylococcales symbiont of Iophon sp. n. MRB-2018]|nr:MAG: exodeoxyribonuclease V subunit beta [Methylococcales symbiont of Iophon sp. n. MRB-2018]KAF3979972.1 MAG: exodeoxyribonuclease V subunit beta [Methylococcales symbiont of Iophon sp. n. MRB-2018]
MKKPFAKFDPIKTELLPGINLIEASAGTGKTYAIAMLVLRFVVEKNLSIKQILVVTFTQAATEELKDRIRTRLLEARRAFNSEQATVDDNLTKWLNSLQLDPQLIIQRINHALFDIDQASIFTLHGFCQRMLAEYALESGQLFDSELTGDVSSIKQALADDFWRKQIYTRTTWEAALLTSDYQTPDKFLASVNFITTELKVLPEYEDFNQKLTKLKQLLKDNRMAMVNTLQLIQQSLSEGKFKKQFSDTFDESSQSLIDWMDKNNNLLADFSIFSETGLINALDGKKFKKSQKNPQTSEQQKKVYIQSLEINNTVFETVDYAITKLKLAFRRALLETLGEKLDKKLEQHNILSFDHLISRLDAALRNEGGSALCNEIRQCYQVALIDEFQDTDKNQWFIISKLFHSANHYLYLIGDPKQAIYKFRGADINSYFVAQQQAEHNFTLSYNWRSQPTLVNAINALFKKPKAFYSEHLKFYSTESALTDEQGTLTLNGKKIPPLVLWQLEKCDKNYWSAGKASIKIKQGVVNEILNLLSADFVIQEQSAKKIQAKDIAILVETHVQAQQFQQALNESGITAVINSKQSIFSSAEATDLYILLQAIAHPTHDTLVKQALALPWFNLNGQQLFQLINNEVEYDAWLSRFQNYFLNWQKNGLMTMMRHLMTQEKVQENVFKADQAERTITNLQHLIELLQQAIIDEHLGVNKTLDWLVRNITTAESSKTTADEQQLRLESDGDAVKIITMHSAKGLEFAIVFCPFLWHRGTRLKKEKQLIKCYKNQQMIADLGTEQFELHRLLALEEELAENIRVFYVAVTRAKYRCYINWANVRSKEKANDSAMAYLLDCGEGDFLAQQTQLNSYSLEQADAFEYRLLTTEQSLPANYQTATTSTPLVGRQRQRSLYTSWQMSSYTSLSVLSAYDAIDIPEIATDKARELLLDKVLEPVSNDLPRGAHTGNVIHDLLENIAFNALADNTDISVQRESSCLRYGLKIDVPEKLDQLLNHTVSTLLTTDDSSFKLTQLSEQQCLKEMPFYLPVKSFNTSQINATLKDCPSFQALSEKTISGYLTGFIDLICQHQGKYYVLDYKSNHLPNYEQDTMIKSMREHNYGLQYWIYSLVLHQYLQNRLSGYRYEQHFGGIKYLFVRGMDKNLENSGVYQTRPEISIIQQLSAQLLPE